jgi:hypothetical protein
MHTQFLFLCVHTPFLGGIIVAKKTSTKSAKGGFLTKGRIIAIVIVLILLIVAIVLVATRTPDDGRASNPAVAQQAADEAKRRENEQSQDAIESIERDFGVDIDDSAKGDVETALKNAQYHQSQQYLISLHYGTFLTYADIWTQHLYTAIADNDTRNIEFRAETIISKTNSINQCVDDVLPYALTMCEKYFAQDIVGGDTLGFLLTAESFEVENVDTEYLSKMQGLLHSQAKLMGATIAYFEYFDLDLPEHYHDVRDVYMTYGYIGE